MFRCDSVSLVASVTCSRRWRLPGRAAMLMSKLPPLRLLYFAVVSLSMCVLSDHVDVVGVTRGLVTSCPFQFRHVDALLVERGEERERNGKSCVEYAVGAADEPICYRVQLSFSG